MLNNIWKGSYILFMYFFVVFLMIFLYVLIKLKRNLLLSPTQKYTLIPMFPKYLASQKKIWKQEREWKRPTQRQIHGPFGGGRWFAACQIWNRAAGLHSRYGNMPCREIDRTDPFTTVNRKLGETDLMRPTCPRAQGCGCACRRTPFAWHDLQRGHASAQAKGF